MLASLSWLDRLLPVWIILAMVVGVLLGSFVPQVGAVATEQFLRTSVMPATCYNTRCDHSSIKHQAVAEGAAVAAADDRRVAAEGVTL